VPDADIRQLRQAAAHHPVHRWATAPADRTTLLVHQAFCRWASTALARGLKIQGPERHLADTLRALRRRGAGRSLETFITLVDAGHHPAAALRQAGAPEGARSLVSAVWVVAAGGSEAARLGSLALGVPCCIVDTGPAVDRLRALAAEDTTGGTVQAEAEAAAGKVLAAQLDLFEAALQVIRRRHMAHHPSMWRPAARLDAVAADPVAPAHLQLLPS
jgi:hypothetical protein